MKLNWREQRQPPPKQETGTIHEIGIIRNNSEEFPGESATKPHLTNTAKLLTNPNIPSPELVMEIKQAVDHVSNLLKENPDILDWYRENEPDTLQSPASFFNQMSQVDAEWERAGGEAASQAVKQFLATFNDMLKRYRVAISG